jgi:DNA-directed RNA polymerase subunit beta'
MNNFSSIKLTIASPEDILQWSYGEVIKPETINYRTQRPEKDGLFSERIFGPTKDWECYCGKYRRIRYKGVVCDKCGVEVTRSNVRRERMGHISLSAPVAHIWFLRNMPSYLSLVLDIPAQKLEKVIYYSAYIVIRVNEENKKQALEDVDREFKSRKKTESKDKLDELVTATKQLLDELENLEPGRIMTESTYYNLARRFGNVFEASSGAEAIRKVLASIDLQKEAKKVEKEMEISKESVNDKKLARRLKVMRAMVKNNLRPEWMILTHLPVLPPDLRPMVPLDGGRYATSDLNDLYRRVINRNNRLKKLLELKA